MPFSPLRQLASARSSRHPVSDTPSAILIHAPRRYPCEPNGITHTPSQLYAVKSLRIWLAPSPDVPAVFEATYNTVVLDAEGRVRNRAARAAFASYLQLPSENTRPSVLGSTVVHLRLFDSDMMRRLTDTSSMDVAALIA